MDDNEARKVQAIAYLFVFGFFGGSKSWILATWFCLSSSIIGREKLLARERRPRVCGLHLCVYHTPLFIYKKKGP